MWERKNRATATAETVAPAAVLRCQDRSSPPNVAVTPRSAARAMTPRTPRAQGRAAAGGAMSRPRTRSVPTMWKEATIARPSRTRSTAWASRGRSPRVWALRGSNARARKARWPSTETSSATSSAPPSTSRSCSRTARTSPNRMPVRSTAKDCERDTMITPIESMPTKSRPMPVSWESLGVRPSAVTPAAMTAALATAPSSRLPPSRAASATPGSSPCDMASPRKAIPLSTTQVPARAQMADTRMPPHKALCTNVTSNGAVNQSMRRTLQ